MPDGKDYEIEVGGKTYELHSDTPLDQAGLQRVVKQFQSASQTKAADRTGVGPSSGRQQRGSASAQGITMSLEAQSGRIKTASALPASPGNTTGVAPSQHSAQKIQPKSEKPLSPKAQAAARSQVSPFALKGPTTIGPPRKPEEPNLLQKGVGAISHLLGLPQGAVAAAAMQPVAGRSLSEGIHAATRKPLSPAAERQDKANVAALQRMNILQRANALSGQNPADPNLGRPLAQGVDTAISRAQGKALDPAMRMAGRMATDPVAWAAGPAGKALSPAARPVVTGVFAAQAAAGSAEAMHRYSQTKDPADLVDAGINAVMAGLAAKHTKGEISATKRLNTLADAVSKSVRPVSPETMTKLAARYSVDPAGLKAKVEKIAAKPKPAPADTQKPLPSADTNPITAAVKNAKAAIGRAAARNVPTAAVEGAAQGAEPAKPVVSPRADRVQRRTLVRQDAAAMETERKQAQAASPQEPRTATPEPQVVNRPPRKPRAQAVKPEAAAPIAQTGEKPNGIPETQAQANVATVPAKAKSSQGGKAAPAGAPPEAEVAKPKSRLQQKIEAARAQMKGEGNAVQIEKPVTRLPSQERPQVGLQGVGESNAQPQEAATKDKTKGKVVISPTDEAKPAVLTPEEAGTLGAIFPKGHTFGDTLSRAGLKGEKAPLTQAGTDTLRKMIENRKLDKSQFPSLYPGEKPAADKYGRPTKTEAGTKRAPVVEPVKKENPHIVVTGNEKATLPEGLSKAAPRYGYGSRNFTLAFGSDIDRAAYITAQEKRSPRDSEYLYFVQKHTGMTEAEVRAHGAAVREHIKGLAKSAPPEETNLPVKNQRASSEPAAPKPPPRKRAPKSAGFIVLPDPREVAEKAKHVGQAVGNFVYGEKQALTKESPRGAEAVNEHENARLTANLEADRNLPAVTAHLSPDDAARFHAYGVADRLAAIKDEPNAIVKGAPARRKVLLANVVKAEAARDAAILTHDPAAINRATKALNEAKALSVGHLKAIADARQALRENALERAGRAVVEKGPPLSVTLPSGKTEVIKESDIQAFFARPEIQKALAAHKAGPEALLHQYQTEQGNKAGVSLGKYSKAYFPAVGLDATGKEHVPGSGKGGRLQASATMTKNMNAQRLEGSAHSYATDYQKVMRDAMEGSLTRATERKMHEALLKEGVMIPYDEKSPDIRTEEKPDPADPKKTVQEFQMKYKGKWEPAETFSLQKYGSRDTRLPDQVVMPARIYQEVRPLFDRETKQTIVDQIARSATGRIMQTYLMAPADAMQHTAALASREPYGAARGAGKFPATTVTNHPGGAVTKTTIAGDSRIVKGIKEAGRGFLAPMRSAVNLIRLNPVLRPNAFAPDLRSRAMIEASKAGILPSDFGDTGKSAPGEAPPKNVFDKKNWTLERIKHPGHNILYGDRGVLSNAITSVYKVFEDNGALKSEEGRSMMRQAMRDTFNTYSKTDKAMLPKIANAVGAGSFYQTGLKNRSASLSAGPHVYAMSLAARAIIITGAVKATTGKYPWDIPGYKWGYVPIYKDPKTGEVLMLDGKIFDRTGSYPDQIVHSIAQNAYDAGKRRISPRVAGWGIAADTINWASAPVVSGPGPQVLSTVTGKLPYAYPDKTLSGLEIADSPVKKLGMTPKRLQAVAMSALPLSSVFIVDPAHEAMASTPKSEDAERFNQILRVMGLPQLRLPVDEAVVEKRRAAAEKAAIKTDAKAMGQPVSSGRRGRSSNPAREGGRSANPVR